MNKVYCSLDERYVNPLFEVFDGGDFILSSYRDIEEAFTQVQIFFAEDNLVEDAKSRLRAALEIVGCAETEVFSGTIPDEDWKLSYRRHFKTEHIGRRLIVRPTWEAIPEIAEGQVVVSLDPGLAFGTGKHETTRACLEYIEEMAPKVGEVEKSFLDMGCGSGILSIAAKKLGYCPVVGFDVDEEAVQASKENAIENEVSVEFFRYGLGAKVRRDLPSADLVVANILGPLLIRFADEIAPCAKDRLVISGILTELYPEVLAAYVARGFEEVSRKSIGEWTTGQLKLRSRN